MALTHVLRCFDRTAGGKRHRSFKMNPLYLNGIYEEEQRRLRADLNTQKKLLRNEMDALLFPDNVFKKLFRLDKASFQNLLEELLPFMDEGRRSTRLSVESRVLAALRFFASGSYQQCIGNNYKIAISQQSVSNALTEVLLAMEHIAPRWIRFPTDEDSQQNIKQTFMQEFHFPGVLGCIDCTHVAILEPLDDEHIYFNRKGYHSKNVQIICTANLEIINVNANFGGASHDAFIWRNSQVYQYMENLYRGGNQTTWLLGDSGYPQQPWLMTPIANTIENTPERAYVDAHASARNTVERCIGQLKTRFRCLLKERMLRYTPHKAGEIINACCVLHNICVRRNVPLDEDIINDDDIAPDPNEQNIPLNVVAEGQRRRTHVVNMYFQ